VQESRVRKELGIAAAASRLMASIEAAEMILCYSVPELDYPFPVPGKMRFVGAMLPPLPEAPHDGLSQWLDAQTSVVYVGFGTDTRLTRGEIASLVEVARRLAGRHAILWKLSAQQQRLLPPKEVLPANLRIERWLTSQVQVLAHPNVRAFFTHGGANAYHEAVYFGKPQVVRPLWMDCADQAVRGQDFGFSLTLDRPQTIDPADVVDKITRVVDDSSFRERADHFGRLLRAAGGRRVAADLLLDTPALATTGVSGR
jgi:polyene glycosyltransferase